MGARGIGQVAAIGAALAWAAKAMVIAAHGLGERPLETVLFLVGLVAVLVSAVSPPDAGCGASSTLEWQR